jgi:uncharacterized protein YgiM (DUF1202 family)
MTFRKFIISALAALAVTHLSVAFAEDTIEPAKNKPTPAERLQITDPYIELHTGPGRGFPVFYVAPRGEWIDIDSRYTDWYKVRTDDDKTGWVHRKQLLTTLTAAGEKKSYRDILVDDYLSRRIQMGAAWGRFNSDPMLKVWASYRLSDTLSLEGTLGQMQGTYAGADFWHINVVSEPWSDQRLSPFFSIGLGKFKNYPNQSLVNAAVTSSQLSNASIGARYYISERFILRADYTIYTAYVTDTNSNEYRAFTAGLAFFF